MATICPNCLRPVRADAKFCGYCGNNLNPTDNDERPVALAAALESIQEESAAQPQAKPSGSKAKRRVLIVIIVLLCLVLLAAFSVYYLQLVR